MKRILTTILLITMLVVNLLPLLNIAHAADSGNTAITPDQLFHKFTYASGAANDKTSKIGIVQSLPEHSVLDLITVAIKFMLTLSASLTLASFTYAGVILVVNQGEEDAITNVKKLVYWNLIALGIIASSYGLVLGVAQLQFFQ